MDKLKKPVKAKTVTQIADGIATAQDADILLLNTGIERLAADDALISLVHSKKRRKNVILVLTTPGGSPDAAYRIARCLQESYTKFIVLIDGYCKSAGTLCILGANEIVMGECAEIGPLDVQLYKKDELGEMNSGLVLNSAIRTLQQQAFSMYESYMLAIEKNGEGLITFKTATEIATRMAIGLHEPMYRQIDPMLIGEVTRSMSIAKAYGLRLQIKSKNFSKEALELLVEKYPSHGFVIDRREATELFLSVRPPNKNETELLSALGDKVRYPKKEGTPVFLSTETQEAHHETNSGKQEKGRSGNDARKSGTSRNSRRTKSADGVPAQGPKTQHIRAVT